jgi:CRP-like cAMP-binding protein
MTVRRTGVSCRFLTIALQPCITAPWPGAPWTSSRRCRSSRASTTASCRRSPARCGSGSFPRGTRTEEGAGGAGFFVVEAGEAEVTVDGEPRGTIGEGDYFGEIALLTGSDRTATITAKSDMLCWGMTPWDFRPLVESNSTIAWKLLTAMADKLK